MKKKNHKRRNRRQVARHEEQDVPTKRPANVEKKNGGSAPLPWLRIFSNADGRE
jgi:hypothetical protein